MFGLFESVDGVLADLKRKVERLHTIQAQKVTEADVLEEDAGILMADARDARQEAIRAGKLAAKLSKLLVD